MREEKTRLQRGEKWVCSTGARGRTGLFGWKWAENGSLWSEGRRWIEKGGAWARPRRDEIGVSTVFADGALLQLAAAGSPPRSSAAERHYG